ncbi:hypothetical protein [Emticicia fontis]
MKHTRNFIFKIKLCAFGFALAACSSSDNPNPDGIGGTQPKEIILPVIGTDVDGFTVNAKGILTALNINPDNAFSQKFSSDPNAIGPKVVITFTNTNFSTLNSSIENSFVGRLADWENTSIEIKSQTPGNPVAEKMVDNGLTKATTIKHTKVYRPVMFEGFNDKESVQAAWKSITDSPKTWTIINEEPTYKLQFKYNKENWTIKP